MKMRMFFGLCIDSSIPGNNCLVLSLCLVDYSLLQTRRVAKRPNIGEVGHVTAIPGVHCIMKT